jgi:hypothetical protein
MIQLTQTFYQISLLSSRLHSNYPRGVLAADQFQFQSTDPYFILLSQPQHILPLWLPS